MKHKMMYLVLIALFIAGKVYPQLNNFDLSKYKLPNLERKSLDTYFDFSGNNDFNKHFSSTMPSYNVESRNQYNSNIHVNYNSYLNNANWQKYSNIGADFTSYFYNTLFDKRTYQRSFTVYPSLFVNSVNRKYFSSNKFFEFDPGLNYSFHNLRYSIDTYAGLGDSSNIEKNNQKEHTLKFTLPLAAGVGRIEYVDDARQAIYIFDELAKQGKISSDISDQDIIQFAELISQLHTKRFFDSRIRKIYQLEAIDSFLVSNNYVMDHDIRYFTTLSDFWDYGDSPARSSGTRLSVVLYPGYTFYNYKDEGNLYYNNGVYNVNAFLISGGLELVHEKPVNLYWQNSINMRARVGAAIGKFKDKLNSSDNEIKIPDLQLGYFQTLGFYPSTRTRISYTYDIQYVQLFDKSNIDQNILGAQCKAVRLGSELSVNYYISQKVRLDLASSLFYVWQNSKDGSVSSLNNIIGNSLLSDNYGAIVNSYSLEKQLKHRFSLSLIYSIF